MYQLLGVDFILRAFAFLCLIIFLIIYFLTSANTILEICRIISYSITIGAILTYVLGQTSVFPWLCKKLPLKMPCLDGTWEGELKSNWPKIAERCDLKTENLKPTPVTVIVIVRLLFIKVILNSDSGYSNSKTLAVSIKRDKETGLVELCYIYDNTTKAPENTDSSQHYGAACLSLTKHDETLVLDGVYWTNRNWQNAMNTAGILTLKKSKNS